MTWVANSFLVFAVFCAVAGLVASLSVRRPLPILILPIFAFGLMTSELTWFFFGLQLALSALFIKFQGDHSRRASWGVARSH
jgi:hypothetical protein